MKTRLAQKTIDKLRPKATEYFVWDDVLRGFGCRVRPSGRKFYLLKYRVNGTRRFVAIGEHGTVTTGEARTKARELVDAVARGLDPSGRSEGPVLSVADLCHRFMEAHAAALKDRTREEYARWIKLHIAPKLGPLPLADVGHNEVANLHASLRHKPTTANRCLAVLSSMFSWADTVGHYSGDNPCRKVRRYREQSKERFLSDSERTRLFAVLDRHQGDEPMVVAAIKLLAYTGCRKQEVLTLQWDHVDLEHKCFWLPDSKTGKRKVMLNAPALTVLSTLGGDPTNPYVIQGRYNKGRLQGLQRPWKRICTEAGLDNLRLHDLRHSFISAGIAAGVSLDVMGRAAGHKSVATTAKYAHLSDNVLRDAVEAVGNIASGNGTKG